MKAAIATKYGEQLEIMDVPVPVPTSGQILVRIRRSGCCHTDIHAIDGDWPVKSKLPLCPGHEGAGEVVSVGPDVTFPKIGDRVGVAWLHSACGRCEYCVNGWETLCTRQHNTGYSVDGKQLATKQNMQPALIAEHTICIAVEGQLYDQYSNSNTVNKYLIAPCTRILYHTTPLIIAPAYNSASRKTIVS